MSLIAALASPPKAQRVSVHDNSASPRSSSCSRSLLVSISPCKHARTHPPTLGTCVRVFPSSAPGGEGTLRCVTPCPAQQSSTLIKTEERQTRQKKKKETAACVLACLGFRSSRHEHERPRPGLTGAASPPARVPDRVAEGSKRSGFRRVPGAGCRGWGVLSPCDRAVEDYYHTLPYPVLPYEYPTLPVM